MNLLGKIFTVLIFIMSLMFMAFSVAIFAAHKNWKDASSGLSTELTTAEAANADLRAEIDRINRALEVERAARVRVLAILETKLVQAQQQLAQKETQLATLTSTHSEAVATMRSTEETLVGVTGEVRQLRQEIRDAQDQRNTIFNEIVRLTDMYNEAQGIEDTLLQRQTQLLAEITRRKRVMDQLGVDESTPVAHIPPKLDGVVRAVSQTGRIEISLGADDGVREGHLFDVFRGANFLGRARVIKTDPDVAVAEILKEFQRGIQIREGDIVRTKIN